MNSRKEAQEIIPQVGRAEPSLKCSFFLFFVGLNLIGSGMAMGRVCMQIYATHIQTQLQFCLPKPVSNSITKLTLFLNLSHI